MQAKDRLTESNQLVYIHSALNGRFETSNDSYAIALLSQSFFERTIFQR